VLLVLLRPHQDKQSVCFVKLESLFRHLHKLFVPIARWAMPVMRDPRIAFSVRSVSGFEVTLLRMASVNDLTPLLSAVKNVPSTPNVEAGSVYQSPYRAFGPRVLTEAPTTPMTPVSFIRARQTIVPALKILPSVVALSGAF